MLENLKTKLSLFIGSLLLSFNLSANEWTTGTNSILDLRNYTETTQYNLGDASRSGAVGIGFDFDFYNQTYTQGYISTNGCFSFTTAYCNDYTPDPLPDTNHTIYPFWTDLIRDNGSKILTKKFEVDGANDYFVVGWYNLREYNRPSDNTFELLLYENNSAIEFRYGDLDIINHDVLVGLQGTSTEYTQYLFHDECNTGTTNVAGTCVNTNWNDSNFNTLLENKSLSYSNQCAINPLSSTECAGYQVAYFAQQCSLNPLYDNACTGYWQAYDDQQCDLDPQYAPFCPGYTTQQSVAYFIADEFDYGYEEEFDYGYVEEEYFWEEPLEYFQEFYSQEHVDDPFLPIVIDDIPEELIWLDPPEEHLPFDDLVYIIEEELPEIIEDLPIFEEEILEFLPDFEEYDLEYVVQMEEPLIENIERILLMEEIIDEPIEEAIEFESLEELEEQLEELEEEIEELEEEEVEEIEEEELEEEEKENKIEQQLKVVKGTMLAAVNSVSGTTAGTSLHSTGTSRASGGTSSSTTTSASVSGSTGGGISFSSSPSISAQIVSSAVQTQQVLTMSSAVDTGSQSSMGTTTEVTTVEAGVDTGMSEGMTAETVTATVDVSVANTESSDTSVVETSEQPTQTVAQNIKQQQQEMEEQQSETGEYADSSELIAIMGTVEGFDVYTTASMPPQPTWYEPKDIYANAVLPDNVRAFAGLASASINQLTNMRNLQPNLDGGNHGMVK